MKFEIRKRKGEQRRISREETDPLNQFLQIEKGLQDSNVSCKPLFIGIGITEIPIVDSPADRRHPLI